MHKERELADKYGKVRPVIHAGWRGKRWIAVGDLLLSSSQWKTFVDFLGDYIKFVLTPEWGMQELAKPLQQRHVIMQWYERVCGFQKEHIGTAGEIVQFVPSGVVAAYFSLAYDLYLLNHHQCLQTSLVRRLKHSDQFQGARYELFAAATALRAGFDLHFEDESDGRSKHPEFIATHIATGQKVAIEAKSRHRDGVLGRLGRTPKGDVSSYCGRPLFGAGLYVWQDRHEWRPAGKYTT